MKKLLIVLSIIGFSFILISCIDRYKDGFIQDIDNNIQLEKTTLGISVIADSLDVPWEILWGPDNWIWITEQKGIISRINPKTGEKNELLEIKDVWMNRTTGLLGMVVHPDQKKYPFVFVNYTIERNKKYFSKLERYTYKKGKLIEPKTIMEIPAARAHNGSRLAFMGKDKILWATGDVAKDGNAQDVNSLNGKILRMDFEGNIPKDNPFKNSYVYALGFRNIQGLVFASNGKLYASEHGDAIEDEINLVMPKQNYGWKNIEGFHDLDFEKEYAKLHNTVEPIYAWTPTVAPAGLDYYSFDKIPEWNNSLLLTTLKGKSFRVLKLSEDGQQIVNEEIFLEDIYGRIRDLCVSPDGDIYISTSNHDWNPMTKPGADDDRILRVARVKQAEKTPLRAKNRAELEASHNTGNVLYQQYCVSCHRLNGRGLKGTFPALAGNVMVHDNQKLITTVLKGAGKDIMMPAFNFLSDEQLAKILNFVKQSWGNKADSLTVNEIQKLR